MQRYTITEEELEILTTTHFSLTNPTYYANLDNIPIKDIKEWISRAKSLSPKVKKVATWLNIVEVYINLTKLTGIPFSLIPSHTFIDILYKAGLVTSRNLDKVHAARQLLEFCQEEQSDWDYYFICRFTLDYHTLPKGLTCQLFKDLDILSYRSKEYFYKMFHYLTLDIEESDKLGGKNDLLFIKKCIGTWSKIFKKLEVEYLQDKLEEILNIKVNTYFLECICGVTKFHEVTNKTVNINSKCEQILGIPHGTHPKKAKTAYLQLIKANHPDRHPENFELYSKKTAEINQAWKEWSELNEF